MKIITCTVRDEDVVKVVGTLIKIGADFNVTAEEAPTPPARHLQRATAEGLSANDVLINMLAAKSPLTREAITEEFVRQGFAQATGGATVSKLVKAGLVRRSKNLVYSV